MTTGPTNGPNKRKKQIAMLMLADKVEEVPAPTPMPVAVVADAYGFVVGVDTHAKFHRYAIVEAGTGRVVDEATFPTSRAGLARAADWIGRRTAGEVEAVLISCEGTGSYGARLSGHHTGRARLQGRRRALAQAGARWEQERHHRRDHGRT